MSKCAKGQQNTCCICLKEDSVTIRATRGSNNKNNWIRCDCFKLWFHSTCGGYNISQYNKVTNDQIWLKCIVCCMQQVLSSDSEDSTSSCLDLVIQLPGVVSRRLHAVSKTSTTKASKRKSLTESKPVVGDLSLSAGTSQSLLNFSQNITVEKDKEESACIAGNIRSESDISANFSDHKEFTINTATSFDNILVIDNISNPVEFVPTNRILKEINLYCPEVKVDFAYQLARGGVAIHAHSLHDRNTLLSNLPKESFGGGIKHLPKGKCSDTVFIKGVGISTHLQEVTQQLLQRLSVRVLDIRRLVKRISGRPTPVVKVRCTHDSVERLLNSKIVIDNKSCVVEKQRSVRIIRFFFVVSVLVIWRETVVTLSAVSGVHFLMLTILLVAVLLAAQIAAVHILLPVPSVQHSSVSMNVLQNNIQSVRTSLPLLRHGLHRLQIDVALLQEVWHPIDGCINITDYSQPIMKW